MGGAWSYIYTNIGYDLFERLLSLFLNFVLKCCDLENLSFLKVFR